MDTRSSNILTIVIAILVSILLLGGVVALVNKKSASNSLTGK